MGRLTLSGKGTDMGLQIQLEGGRYRPVVVCDHCGILIEDARRGNYQWLVGERARAGGENTIFFTHKDCCRPFEEAHGGRRAWAWAPLSCFPIFLAANLNLDLQDA